MRKYQQDQLSALVKTLMEANAEIKRLFLQGDLLAATRLLADSQEFVVQTGEFIEAVAGEGTETVMLLESYYESLYAASVEMVEGAEGSRLTKHLQKDLIRIESSIQSELKPDRIEVVFFPYKASMWDSLESIWLAARDDPRCDAYVVPIPYYEKRADGSLGKIHYEGGEYPAHVPVTDWREYDVAVRRPDAVFIHNPYDEGNRVTSVHPAFYSSRLKELTNLLCYVPYFVAEDIVEDSFCTAAACRNAHVTVLQSKPIRNTYIRVFKDAFGSAFGSPRDKFVSLGSPKFDKVIRTKREDCPLPPHWREQIGGRKVVLYNTTLAGILKGNERYLKKLRFVLDSFRERGDVALWWRPHPLSEATVGSMRPHLRGEYTRIVEAYQREGFGIYDDTSELHRAISWSDGYYGDGSSVADLYRVTGKPVLIQDVEAADPSEPEEFKPAMILPYLDNEHIYYTEEAFNGLFRIDKATCEADYLGCFPAVDGLSLYREPVRVGDKLFFAPGNNGVIGIYDLKAKAFCEGAALRPVKDRWQCGRLDYKCNPGRFFRMNFALVFDNLIYFIPYRYPAIVCLDTATNELVYFDDFLEPLSELVNAEDSFLSGPCLVSAYEFAMTSPNANALILFDIRDNTSKVYPVGKRGYRFSSVCFDGECYWLSPRTPGTPFVKWNPEQGVVKEIKKYPISKTETLIPFCSTQLIGERLYAFFSRTNGPFQIDTSTCEVTPLKALSDKFVTAGDVKHFFSCVKADRSKLFLYQQQSGSMFVYDTVTEETLCCRVTLSEAARDVYLKKYDCHIFQSGLLFGENSLITLNGFLKHLAAESGFGVLELGEQGLFDGCSGQRIYNSVKQQILS